MVQLVRNWTNPYFVDNFSTCMMQPQAKEAWTCLADPANPPVH